MRMNKVIASVCAATVLGMGSVIVAPMALAGPGACVEDGNTVEFCDQKYLAAIDSTGLKYEPGATIALGHEVADIFAQHPYKKVFVAMVRKLMSDELPKQPINAQQATFVITRCIVFYAPKGTEQKLNQVMAG